MMCAMGLAKLVEELGELSQVAGKKLAYFDTDDHPDGAGSLKARMEDEMGDVLAIIEFVGRKFGLDVGRILDRKAEKAARFARWDSEL